MARTDGGLGYRLPGFGPEGALGGDNSEQDVFTEGMQRIPARRHRRKEPSPGDREHGNSAGFGGSDEHNDPLCEKEERGGYMIHSLKNRLPETALLAVILLSAIVPLGFLISYLRFPYPLAYREAAPVIQAMAFHRGQNPYLLEGFPARLYVYGPLYPIMISPWIGLLRPTLLIPRLINVFFLALSVILFYALLRARKASVVGALAGSAVMGNALCLVLKIAGPGPDIPAFCFMMAGFYALQKCGPSSRAMWIFATCGALSFYIKQYFIIPFVLYGAYIFIFRSKRNGLLHLAVLSVLMFLPAVFLRLECPLYFRYTVLHHMHMYSNDTEHMVMQIAAFLTWYAVPIVLLAAAAWLGIRRAVRSGDVGVRMHIGSWARPLAEGVDADFYTVGFLLMMLIMVFSMGRNAGTAHTYFQELPLPLLIVSAITFIANEVRARKYRIVLFAACLFSLLPLGAGYQIDFTQTAEGFRELEERADRCVSIYGSAVMDMYLLDRDPESIYDSGNTEFAATVLYAGNPLLQKLLGGHDGQIEHQWIVWNEWLGEMAGRHAFDCIIVGSEIQQIGNVQLAEYYEPELEIPYILEWDVINYSVVADAVFWIPKQ